MPVRICGASGGDRGALAQAPGGKALDCDERESAASARVSPSLTLAHVTRPGGRPEFRLVASDGRILWRSHDRDAAIRLLWNAALTVPDALRDGRKPFEHSVTERVVGNGVCSAEAEDQC